MIPNNLPKSQIIQNIIRAKIYDFFFKENNNNNNNKKSNFIINFRI